MSDFTIVKLLDKLNPTIITGGFVPRGAYDNATDYAVGDSVDYLGSSYVMWSNAAAGTLPTDTDYWQVVANGGVSSVNTKSGIVVLDPDDLDDTATTNKFTTAGDISKLAGIEASADVTDTANVTSAGALMDSEVTSLSGVKSLTVPDSTTISAFGATLIDDADAATARTTLGVDAAGTDNSTDVTLGTNTATALSLAGQQLSLADVFVQLAGDTMSGDLIFSGSQKIIGGTGTTSDLTFQTTSGVGATGADMHFLVGNNGATEAMTILNSGFVGFGTTSPLMKVTIDLGLSESGAFLIRTVGANTNHFVMEDSNVADASTPFGYFRMADGKLTMGNANRNPATGLTTGSTDRFTIDSTGNVGIGTTAPSRALDVVGEFLLLGSNRTNSTAKLGRLASAHYTNSEEPVGVFIANATSTTNDISLGGGSSLVNAATAISFYTAANNTTTTGTLRGTVDSAGNWGLGLNGGNVGIGTTIPGNKFQVEKLSQTHNTEGSSSIMASNGTKRVEIGYDATIDAGFIWAYHSATAAKPLVLNAAGGNVGIGTTAPAGTLNVHATGQPNYYMTSTNNSGAIIRMERYASNGNYFTIETGAGNRDTIEINPSSGTGLVMNTSGNVGIGTTAPQATLDIVHTNNAAGGIRLQDNLTNVTTKVGRIKIGHYTNAEEPVTGLLMFSTSTSNEINYGGGSGSENAATTLNFYTGATTTTTTGTIRMQVNSFGNVGIGTTSQFARLHVFGTVDDEQLIVQAHSTQTAPLFQLWNSSAAVLVSFSGLGGAIFNEQGADADFRVEGDTDADLLFADASTDRVGIGLNTPGYKLDVNGDINLPAGSAYRVGGTAGVSGTFTTVDLKTVTVTKGIITSIV